MKKLQDYLATSGISQRAFAKRIGIDHSVVSRFVSGTASPSLKTALRIQRESGGAVPVTAWDQAA